MPGNLYTDGQETEPVLEEVCGVLGLQDLQITNSREYGGVVMTYLSD